LDGGFHKVLSEKVGPLHLNLLDNVDWRNALISHFNFKEVSSCQKFDPPTIAPTLLGCNKNALFKQSRKKKRHHQEQRLSEK